MAPEASPGRVAASIYMLETDWRAVRRHALDHEVSASSVVAALLERYMASAPADQAPVLERAREITLGRRSRSD